MVGCLTPGLDHIGLTSNVEVVAVLILDEGLDLWLNLSDIDSTGNRSRGNGGGARRVGPSCAEDRTSCSSRSTWNSVLLGNHNGALLYRHWSLLQLIDLDGNKVEAAGLGGNDGNIVTDRLKSSGGSSGSALLLGGALGLGLALSLTAALLLNVYTQHPRMGPQ